MPSELLATPLNAVHRRLGARMVDFAGWDMPVQYPSGILAEHQAVRERCGLFDLSHMGRVHLRGRDALPLAQACCTRDLSGISSGTAAYSLVCNEGGGILDDVIAYVLHEREIVFVFNASNRLSDTQFFTTHRDRLSLDVDILDLTFETALIGIQGPSAQQILQRHCSIDLEPMPGYAFSQATVAGAWTMVARTGYTGEDGFELVVQAADAETVWNTFLQASVPCGLGARDTLRTEAGFALYGHDISVDTNPFEARLGWVVNFSKADFVGRSALERIKTEGVSRRLVGLRVAPGGVPRPGIAILDGERTVGNVTSGTYSPTLKQNIAMGYVPTQLSSVGKELGVEVRGKPAQAVVENMPFVPHRSRPRATM